MRHRVQFQYRPSGDERPLDYGQDFELEVDQTVTLPIIGDHVSVGSDSDGKEAELSGVVENRLFYYAMVGSERWCFINIVLTDSSTPMMKLIKE